MQQDRVQPTSAEQHRVNAVDGGAQDTRYGTVRHAPGHDQCHTVAGRAGLPGEDAGDDEDGRQKDDEDDGATPDEVDGQLAT